jgi:hypothetical protein
METDRQIRLDQFISATHDRYFLEIVDFIKHYRRDRLLTALLTPLLKELQDYLYWLRWVGWNVAPLVESLHNNSAAISERLALAMLVYASGRLIDDGIDHHSTFKQHRNTLVGAAETAFPKLPVHSCDNLSTLFGFSLYDHGMQRMRECGHHQCSDDLSRLFQAALVGFLAEICVGRDLDRRTYQQIVRRKAVAYNMMLYKPLLFDIDPPLRDQLLKTLGIMDELAQLLNDIRDVDDDKFRGQPSAVTSGVYVASELQDEIRSQLAHFHEQVCALPAHVRVVMSTLCDNLDAQAADAIKAADCQEIPLETQADH